MAHSSLAIANEMLKRARPVSAPMTQMQAQKLVYLAHGWALALLDRPLIDDVVEAWDYGPVIRRLYDATKNYGKSPIRRFIRWGDDTPFKSDDDGDAFESLVENEASLLDAIWENYGKLEAFQLSALTHAPDSPWSKVYRKGTNRPIPENLIQSYFKTLAPDGGAANKN